MVRYCPTHGIGFNPAFDPVCPQCSLARMPAPESLAVDENPSSATFGFPIREGELEGDRTLPRVK